MMEHDTKLLQNAVKAFRNIPVSGTAFSKTDAMLFVGLPADLAKTSTYTVRFTRILEQVDAQEGCAEYPHDREARRSRYITLCGLIACGPNAIKKRTEVMQLAGIPPADHKGGSYVYYHRAFLKAFKNASTNQSAATLPPHAGAPPYMLDLERSAQSSNQDTTVSPLSTSSTASTNTISSSTTGTYYNFSDDSQEDASIQLLSGPPSNRTKTSAIASLTGRSQSRSTIHQAGKERHDGREWDNMRSFAIKVGTNVLDLSRKMKLQLEHLKTADQIAGFVNTMMQCKVVSGRTLTDAVRDGRAGASPPRLGRPSTVVNDEDFKDLCSIFFTLSSIEQSNGDPNRMEREELTSLLGRIVKSKQQQVDFDEVALYKRILYHNSNVQAVNVVDPREARRHAWLKYTTLEKHYQQWECEMLRLGFARKPIGEEELKREGHVVFHDEQLQRYVGLDECKISLASGKKDEHTGGRPGSTPTNPLLPDPGKASEKSSKCLTVLFGHIGDEAFAPLLIFPTSAQPENRKIYAKHIGSLQQICGKFGHSMPRWHDCSVATSPHGSMTSEIFDEFITEKLVRYWPDLEDSPGKRVIISADGGPGRMNSDFLAKGRILGIYHMPKCPNTTEETQEMDQLFSALKSAIYRNRDVLYKARFEVDGYSASLGLEDVGHLIFGGRVEVTNRAGCLHCTRELPNAFSLYLSPTHIKRAREKCGYFPATRQALRSTKVRVEVADLDSDSEGESQYEDPMQLLLLDLERHNHEAVHRLKANGYAEADAARRYVKRIRVSTSSVDDDDNIVARTEPNTRERRLALEQASTAGQFYAVTNGGQVANHSDFLISREFKRMRAEAKDMRSVKKKNERFFKSIEPAARKAYRSNYEQWNVNDLKAVISYRRGPKAEKDLPKLHGLKKAGLKKLYDESYKGNPSPRWQAWSFQEEEMLQRLEKLEVNEFEETVIYAKALESIRRYFGGQLSTFSEASKLNILAEVRGNNSEDMNEKIVLLFSGHDIEDIISSNGRHEDENSDDSSHETNDSGTSFMTICAPRQRSDAGGAGQLAEEDDATSTVFPDDGGNMQVEGESNSRHHRENFRSGEIDTDDESSGTFHQDDPGTDEGQSESDAGGIPESETGGASIVHDSNRDDGGDNLEQEKTEVSFSMLKINNDGVNLLQRELEERKVGFRDTWKINELKRVLKTTVNDNKKFEPKSKEMLEFWRTMKEAN
jgi:hypothetical protein